MRKVRSIRSSQRRFLLLGVLVFLLTLASSFTATFAWYSLSDFAVINIVNFSTLDVEENDFQIGAWDEKEQRFYWIGDPDNTYDFRKEETLNHFFGYSKEARLRDFSSMFESDWLNEGTDRLTALPTLRKTYAQSTSRTMTDAAPRSEKLEDRVNDGFFQFEFYLIKFFH